MIFALYDNGKALPGESLAAAIATKNSGGIVIVQVERIAAYDQIPRSLVRIPGNMLLVCQHNTIR